VIWPLLFDKWSDRFQWRPRRQESAGPRRPV